MNHRIHVIQIPTTQNSLFPYSHYADQGHDPYLTVFWDSGILYLKCEDLFKLKPNIQRSPRDRIDIYIPHNAAVSLGTEISGYVGTGMLAGDSGTDPERFRRGRQTLPLMDSSKSLYYDTAYVSIAGYTLSQNFGRVFMEPERPNTGHIEMKGPEVHLGFDLRGCAVTGGKDLSLIQPVSVPASELRAPGEHNPVEKAMGEVLISFDLENAKKLGSTLLFFGARA